MKIKFGTTLDNVIRAELLSIVLFFFSGCLYFKIQDGLDKSHRSFLRSRAPNVTSVNIHFFCGIPYDDCLCSVQSTTNKHLKYCLTDNFLMGSRIFPLVSFVLQICLIQHLFSFNGKHVRIIVYVLWITSVFIFIIIANGIYRSSCFHRYINGIFCCINMLLFLFMFLDLLNYKNIDRCSRNDLNTVNDQILEKINNDPISCQELV